MKTRFATACALGLFLSGCATPALLAQAGRDAVAPLEAAAQATSGEQTGNLALSLAWPGTREIQAVDGRVARVSITVQTAGRQQVPPIEVSPADLVAGLAKVTIGRLPIGEASVKATMFGKSGSVMGEGSATARIEPDTTTEASLTVTIRPPSGSLKVTIDSALGDAEEPTVVIGESGGRDAGGGLPSR